MSLLSAYDDVYNHGAGRSIFSNMDSRPFGLAQGRLFVGIRMVNFEKILA